MYVHHGLDHEYPRGAGPRVCYMICTTPRAGSSLMCDALALTELAGTPTEYFDGDTLATYWLKWGATSFEQYLNELRAHKTTPNGVFGVQIHYPQFEACFGERDVLRDFPGLRCIHLTRKDRVRQAVSLFRAQATDQWALHQYARRPAPLFNGAAIRACLETIEANERGWKRVFAERGIEPMRIAYEDFDHDYERGILAVLQFLGVELPDGFAVKPPTLRRQADEWSEYCVRGYGLMEQYGPDLAGAPPAVRSAWSIEQQSRADLRKKAVAEMPGAHDLEGFIDDAHEERNGLHVSGWLLLDGTPADGIELQAESESERAIASVRRRPDLELAFPAVKDAALAGFEVRLPASSFAIDGAWRFTLCVRRGAEIAFRCRIGERPGIPPTSFPRPLGAEEVRFHPRRDAIQADVRPVGP